MEELGMVPAQPVGAKRRRMATEGVMVGPAINTTPGQDEEGETLEMEQDHADILW
jgi:hypothetical protein